MPRVYIPSEITDSPEPRVSGETAKRLSRVLRLEHGDVFLAIDDRRQEHTCRILEASPKQVRFEVESSRFVATDPRLDLTVAQAIPKGSRMEFVIQKCVELGARRIIPLLTERSVVRPEPDDDFEDAGPSASLRVGGRERRWGTIAIQAAEQCGRGLVPEVMPPHELSSALSAISASQQIFILDENERETSLREALAQAGQFDSAAILIGPEGGFTQQELERATSHGAQSVTLGPRILRTETAAVVATALIMAYAGELEYR